MSTAGGDGRTERVDRVFFWALLLGACVLVLLVPLLVPGNLYNGYDLPYHMARIKALAFQWDQGLLYTKVNPWFLNGAGYASSMGYPDVLLYLPAWLISLGVMDMVAYELFVIVCIVATFFSSWLALRYFTKDKAAALLGAALYSLSVHHVDVIFQRSALGDIQAFIFLPLFVSGSYDLLRGQGTKAHHLCVAFTGLMLTHVISTVLAVVFLLGFGVLSLHKLTWPRLKSLVGACALAMGLTAFFWMPLADFFVHGNSLVRHTSSTLGMYAVSWWSHIMPEEMARATASSALPLFVGFFVLLRWQAGAAKAPQAASFFGAGLALLCITTRYFPWQYFGWLDFIQFPWRFYSLALFLLVIGISLHAVGALKTGNYKYLNYGLVLVVLYTMMHQSNFMDHQRYVPESAGSFEIGTGREYLPRGINSLEPYAEQVWEVSPSALDATAESLRWEKAPLAVTLTVTEPRFIESVKTNFICYDGYSATARPVQGEAFSPRVMPDTVDKRCTVVLERDFAGEISLSYKASFVQKLSSTLSLATLVLGLVLCLVRAFNNTPKVGHFSVHTVD